MKCADCHMPLMASQDPGNRDGKIHSHRFAAANTAVPYVEQDSEQLDATEKFLKSGFITVDIFAVSPVDATKGQTSMMRRSDNVQANSTFAVGEEAEQSAPALVREVGKLSAPVGSAGTRLEPGSTTRVDVVVRTRKIGHFFPAGTVDAFDAWLELQATDDNGRVLFWSGKVEDDGKGPVEPGAHFYRSLQLDGAGNPIDKRNAWQARSLLYVRLIPPGAADVAHYLVKTPRDAKGPIHLTARLNYRKFSWYFTQFAYAGAPKPGQDPALLTKEFNSLEYSFLPSSIPANVSGKIRGRIPDLPIVTLAEAHATLELGPAGLDAGGAETGSRALERLGHRAVAARRSEGRGVRLQARDGGGARVRRRLAERGAHADSGRRDRRRQTISGKGARHPAAAGPHYVLPGRGAKGRWRL